MNSQLHVKDERINLRLKHNAKLLLERAASVEGQTVSKFVLNSALARAERTLEEHQALTLNVKESEAFYEALAKPVQFNQKLTDALAEHDQRVTSK